MKKSITVKRIYGIPLSAQVEGEYTFNPQLGVYYKNIELDSKLNSAKVMLADYIKSFINRENYIMKFHL